LAAKPFIPQIIYLGQLLDKLCGLLPPLNNIKAFAATNSALQCITLLPLHRSKLGQIQHFNASRCCHYTAPS